MSETECDTCQENTKNRAKWGFGPWQEEPDRVEFEHAGLPCIIHRAPLGHWCGYAAVPPGHPDHGKGYADVDVSVHGGLTYADICHGHVCHVSRPGEPDDVWWLGLDCGHAGDLSPAMKSFGIHGDDNEYRDMAYVTAETRSLAEQLASHGGSTDGQSGISRSVSTV